jgi:hypothetical protein
LLGIFSLFAIRSGCLVLKTRAYTFGGYVRKDQFNYYPSADPFADFSPDLQAQTITQDRKLTNAGLRGDISYVRGIHNIKVGVTYQQTFLTENDTLATVDPGFLGLFNQLDPVTGAPIPGTSCVDPVTGTPTGPPCTILAASDLTSGGAPFFFHGHTDVKETALYVQDTITKGSWAFNFGIRGDIYNGFVKDGQAEPRLGIAYNVKPSNTVLRLPHCLVPRGSIRSKRTRSGGASSCILHEVNKRDAICTYGN